MNNGTFLVQLDDANTKATPMSPVPRILYFGVPLFVRLFVIYCIAVPA
jgi:hypothetical protein